MNGLNDIGFTVPRSAVFTSRRFDKQSLGIKASPSFTISQTDRVFCIGSCFARAVERMLNSCHIYTSFANLNHRYNIFSIEQTVRWALDGGLEPEHFIELDDGTWFDPFDRTHNYTGYPSALEPLRINLDQMEHVKTEIINADVVVVTIGLAEVWHDIKTNAWFNQRPPRSTKDTFSDRFNIVQTTVEQNRIRIIDFVNRIRAVNPKAKILISVSPIALNATFSQRDVLVATMLGKATLRAAVHEAITKLSTIHVDYFPSFEIVLLQRNDNVYMHHDSIGKRDGQHIREDFLINAIRPVFFDAYIEPDLHKLAGIS